MTTLDQSTYTTLQNEHQELLHRAEAGGDALTVEEVQSYIERVKAGAENVSDLRDRNQLRAVLRYWAAWVFERTNMYPDTTLRPALDEPLPPVETVSPATQVGDRDLVEPDKTITLSMNPPISLRSILMILGVLAVLAAAFYTFSMLGQTAAIGLTTTPSVSPAGPQETEAATQTGEAVIPPVRTDTPAAATQTAEAVIPPVRTDTPAAVTLPPTPQNSPTPQPPVPQNSPTPTATSTPEVVIITTTPQPGIPTAPPKPTEPVTGDSPDRDVFEVLIGSDPQKPVDDCSTRSITLQNANPELFADLGAVPSTVRVSQVGDDQVLFEGKLPLTSPDTIEIPLEDADLSQAYLVQIDHPLFPYPSLIVQFGGSCQRNHVRVELRYPAEKPDRRDLPNRISRAEAAAPALTVEWFLTAWGPVPSYSGMWSAELLVTTGNDDGSAIFWDLSGPEPRPLTDRRLVLVSDNCQTIFRRIGVSSEGQSAQKEIILRPASCP